MFKIIKFNESFTSPSLTMFRANFYGLRRLCGFFRAVIAYASLIWFGYSGITFYPYIIIKAEDDSGAVRCHESVHLIQQALLGRKFYLYYIGYYLRNLFKYFNHATAYRKIPYEVEAYKLQYDRLGLLDFYNRHGIMDSFNFYQMLINPR